MHASIRIRLALLVVTLLGSLGSIAQDTDEYFSTDSTRIRQMPVKVIPAPRQLPSEQGLDLPNERPLQPEERLRLGGSFGLGFGTVTNVNLSPMVGYNLSEKLVGGVGATYMWFRSRLLGVNSSNYGGRAFLMYSLLPMVTLQAEYEGMNVQYFNPNKPTPDRTWLGSPLVGGAYTQPLGGRFTRAVHMTLLYNLNYQNQLNPFTGRNISPYSSPLVFRVTFL